jgi:hypothetical protein
MTALNAAVIGKDIYLMDETNLVRRLALNPANRRSFVRKLGVAGAVLGAAAATKKGVAQTMVQDSDIVNFALNLEYLEAEFYTVATTGKTLAQTAGYTLTGTGTQGTVTGGSKVTFTDPQVQATALELASDEQTHVRLLQTALSAAGAQAVAEPAINLNALGFGFANQNDFLALARIFEDIGVTAYGGAAPLLQNKTILGYAARILAVEAEHAGNIRAAIARLGVTTKALDGADHLPPPSGAQYFSTDSNALTEVRTPQQVLYLAYAAGNATSGGFFPNGVNGILNTSSGSAAGTDSATISASPNPIPVVGQALGVTTISWNAPAAMIIQVRVGAPNGPLLTDNFDSGSMTTGAWVTNGMTFYLQDVSMGQANTAANTLGSVTVYLKQM